MDLSTMCRALVQHVTYGERSGVGQRMVDVSRSTTDRENRHERKEPRMGAFSKCVPANGHGGGGSGGGKSGKGRGKSGGGKSGHGKSGHGSGGGHCNW